MADAPTVIVADDEEIVLNFVSLVLRKAGFPVISAIGGREALELVRDSPEPVSLAVLDMVMPDLNGPELFEQLREIYPGMRGLFMSGYNAPQAGVPPGCDFLTKPFTAAELLRRVRETAERPITHRA
jgi:DNA-binding NtrC family response regulator